MNTDNTFLRYFQSDDRGNEIPGTEKYESINDLIVCGPPIDYMECILKDDGFLYYRFEEEFVRLDYPKE